MTKKVLAFAIAALTFGVAGNAVAGSANATLSVTATVSANCTISTTPLAFGAYDPVSVNAAAGIDRAGTGTVIVTCTKNSAGVTIGMGLGSNASGSTRRMVASGAPAEFLTYEIYQPTATTPGAACSSATVWNTGAGLFTPTGVTNWGAASAKTFNVCGTIPKAQDVLVDSYSDTVQATVNF